MSEFLGFAWELLAKVVYNIVAVFGAILNLLVFGWVDYFNIFNTYFDTFNPVGKIGAVILFALLIAMPVLIVHHLRAPVAGATGSLCTTNPATKRCIARSGA
ncbi:MAG: hypothetical protein V8T51_08175 [Senegalimassilia faecalis]